MLRRTWPAHAKHRGHLLRAAFCAHAFTRCHPATAATLQVELAHWKKRTAIFNALVDQITQPDCECAANILRMAKSKVIARWHKLNAMLIDKANESKDNCMYANISSCCWVAFGFPFGCVWVHV